MNEQAIQIEPLPVQNVKKYKKRLRHLVGEAIAQYEMIEDGDRVMVCMSGGKDSFTLLDILLELKKKAPVYFELVAVNLDQRQPGFPEHVLPEYLEKLDVEFHIIEQDTYSIVKEKVPEGKTMCGLCSRLRRGILYKFADKINATKIALGHHRDDIIETMFLNMFFNGQLKAMPPKLFSDDGQHTVIRPLALCKENDIEVYAQSRQFPIIPCSLCGSQDQLQRKTIKQMLKSWEDEYPGRSDLIMRSLQKVVPSHLADNKLYDYASRTGCDK